MGNKDSSKTRVKPVFDRLYATDKTGEEWLKRLLCLPSVNNIKANTRGCAFTIREHHWGKEKQLSPPISLLSWIIRNPRRPTSRKSSDSQRTANIRDQWIKGAQSRIVEGLQLLTLNPKSKAWYIFEGPTQPDVYIETDNLIVVIEGKRTEDKPKTFTTWMPERHQMLRHIDCAWEARGTKRVIGFFIIEGDGESMDVPARWQTYASKTTSPGVIASSLPHRGPEEQEKIAAAFVGVTTWQQVCREFRDLGLDWSLLPYTIQK